MGDWTPEHNTYLSCLLDDVTGTEEMVKMRQDYCKIWDGIKSMNRHKMNLYYTGSKAEGLDLPGSDNDYMIDINNLCDIEVSESMDELVRSTCTNKFLVVRENVPPGFAFLKCVSQIDNQLLLRSLLIMDNNVYLGSISFLSSTPAFVQKGETRRVQGPSIEIWSEYHDKTKSGVDHVRSIRCKFWPASAAEWINRQRRGGWPSLQDRENIIAFGCHLVPVGHPLSANKSLEWRLSFSVAERMLVLSFNHTQIQCYAVMKLVLKEYIKVKCSLKNTDVICSYFIKTFLFWQFETTDQSFWQIKNLIGCLTYLFHEFQNCIKMGVLRHYFIPRFNLLYIKHTPEAQIEFSMILEHVLHCGISILGQCPSFSNVFAKFCQVRDRSQCDVHTAEILKQRFFKEDKICMHFISNQIPDMLMFLDKDATINDIKIYLLATEKLSLINEGHNSESIAMFIIRYLCTRITREILHWCPQENKSLYKHLPKLNKNVYGTNIASSKLWLATFLLYRGDYCTALQKVNDVLSSIPPYALFYSGKSIKNVDAKPIYMDRYNSLTLTALYRAKEAWLMDMHITQKEYPYVPNAIQIELYCCDPETGIVISPFTFAYYLMFLCYHGLGQYDNRERALLQLVDTVYDDERCSVDRYTSYNLVGHCLLMVGQADKARILFLQSTHFSHRTPESIFDKYNSAYHYLSSMYSK